MADTGSETHFQFQSLFSWNLPSDTGSVSSSSTTNKFQSLFSWNLPSDGIVDPELRALVEFQSLFSWNLPSDKIKINGSATIGSVSILVFVELALGQCFLVVFDCS